MKIPGKYLALAVVAFVFLAGTGFYSYANGVRSAGIQKEQALSAQYKINQNELSTYVTKIEEMTDVANMKSAKLDTIISHAVQGRYGQDGFKANGAFFSAVREAYPEIDLKIYDKLATAVESGRDAFKNQQNKLADMVRDYKTWRLDGFVQSQVVSNYFPSPNLEARIGAKVYTGKDALAKIDEMVTTEDSQQAFESGTTKALDLKHR